MIGFSRFFDARRRYARLRWPDQWQLDGSFWASVVVVAWIVLAPFRPQLGPDLAQFAEWVALGIAGAAMITALHVKRRFQRKLELEEELRSIKPTNPLRLIDVLREHGVREFGSMYLYMPIPKRARHDEAWAWLEMLDAKGLIKGEPWHIKAKHAKDTIRESHPNLFEGSPSHFDVFRLDWQTLTQMMGDQLD